MSIRSKIKEIAKNIDKFSMKYDYVYGEYIFKFKKLRIKRKELGSIFVYFTSFWESFPIKITEYERDLLRKPINKRIEKKEEKRRIKKKKEDDELFEKGTELLNKINFN